MNKLLPIGSVVHTPDKENMYIIVGYGGTGAEGIYDYIGLPYPYGFIDKEYVILFNKDRVEEVLYEGMKGEEYDKAVTDMEAIIEASREENSK